jgi:hypothetical protein
MLDRLSGSLGAIKTVTNLATSLNQGFAAVTTGLKASSATALVNSASNVVDAFSGIAGGLGGAFRNISTSTPNSGLTTINGIQHYMNPLEKFASYTPLWTFACLTPQQFNNPASYRGKPGSLKNIVFSSAGRYDNARSKVSAGGNSVTSPEYYVNNFVMSSVLAPNAKTGNSSAISFSWDIYEPYSMGLLLESMQTAAIEAGYANYMDNCPYLLRLDFQGYTENGQPFAGQDKLTKYYVCKLKKVTFDVNEQGSVYKVEAIPYNHLAFGQLINQTYTDISLEGGSVKEVLVSGAKSLCNVLNTKQEQLVKDKKQDFADTYFVWFPAGPGEQPPPPPPTTIDRATFPVNDDEGNPLPGFDTTPPEEFGGNAIGLSTLDFDIKAGGTYPVSKEGDAYDPKTGVLDRGSIRLTPNARTLMFTQGQTITQMITSVIMNSKYVYSVFDEVKKTPTGEVYWFKVDVQIQLKEFDSKRSDYAKHIIYRVIPYKVHSSIFTAPGAVPQGYKQLTKKIVKNYNYIYTGLNQDIIKFNLQFNNMFFTGTRAAKENNSRNIANKGASNSSNDQEPTAKANDTTNQSGQVSRTGTPPVGKELGREGADPTGEETVQKRVAAQFQDAFLKGGSGDMIQADMEILGDTYYLVDSGLSNYYAPEYQDGINADGTMTYDGSDVYIYVTFRTPVDVAPEKGLYDFKSTSVSPFSGIFKIIKVDSMFKDGLFTQNLKLTRMQKQPTDFEGVGEQRPDAQTAPIIPGEVAEPPTQPPENVA